MSAEALEYAGQSLKDDGDFMLAAMQRNSHTLGYASQALLESKDFILAAVATGGYTLCHVPEAWLLDKDVVLAALSAQGCAVNERSLYTSCQAGRQRGQRHKELIIRLVQTTGDAMHYLDECWKTDYDVNHTYHCGLAAQSYIRAEWIITDYPAFSRRFRCHPRFGS